MSAVLFNCRSIINKLHEFSTVVSNCNFSIIGLCETWLNSSIPDSLLNDNGRYTVFRYDRLQRGGGVCLLLDKYVLTKTVQIVLSNEYSTLELIAVDVWYCNCKTRFVLLYRPPHVASDIDYHSKLVKCLTELSRSCSRLLIFGDFNLPEVDWSNGSFSKNSGYTVLCEFLFEIGLFQLVNAPTRENNILDLVFVNNPCLVSNIDTCPPLGNSDHNGVEFSLQFSVQNETRNVHCKKVYLFDKGDWLSFANFLCVFDWLIIFANCVNVEDYWFSFLEVITIGLDAFVPCKRVTGSSRARVKKRYPRHIHRLLNRKRCLWRKFSKCKNIRHKARYKRISKQCSFAINNFHAFNEKRLIDRANTNAFYKFVNAKLSCKSDIPPLLTPSGDLCFNDLEKADLLNNQFTSVFITDNNVLPPYTASANVIYPFNSLICTPSIVHTYITKLKNSKSCGTDNIMVVLLKKTFTLFISALVLSFQYFFVYLYYTISMESRHRHPCL